MATRYSGLVTIRIRYVDSMQAPHGHYRVQLTSPVSMARRGFSCVIGTPAYLTHAVDSSEAYDAVARAALSFCAAHAEGSTSEDTIAVEQSREDANTLISRAVYGWDPSAMGGQGWEVFRREIDAVDSRNARKAG